MFGEITEVYKKATELVGWNTTAEVLNLQKELHITTGLSRNFRTLLDCFLYVQIVFWRTLHYFVELRNAILVPMNFFAINIPEAVLPFVLLLKGGMFFKDDQVHPDFGVFCAELKWVVKKIHQYLQEACRVPLQAFEKHGIINPILGWY